MTGKGDRWGRDRIGRSAPAFLSTTALPPLTCTARGQLRRRQLLFAAKPANCGPFVLRPVPDGESAGCVCLQCCSAGFLFACLPFCLTCPLPLSSLLAPSLFSLLCPVHFCFICHLFIAMCARIGQGQQFVLGPAVCVRASSLPATTLSRWQLQHGPAVAARAPGPIDSHLFFFLQSP